MKAINVAKVPVVLIAMILMLRGVAFGQGGWTDDRTTVRLTTSTDKVGIGTSSPWELLTVFGADATIGIQVSGVSETGALNFKKPSGNGIIAQITSKHSGAEWSENGDLTFKVRNSGVSTDAMYIDKVGNVGIGTTNPGEKLEVSGGATKITNTGNGAVLLDLNTERHWQFKQFGTGESTALELKSIDGGGNKHFLITTDGGVGIGTTNPQTKLAVNGTITTKEVKVTNSGWSDFVFEDGYNLMPLAELEQSIKENGRLPGIPSSEEVAANGISLGEMQAKFLQKIEELTLYMIELKTENEELKERVTILEK